VLEPEILPLPELAEVDAFLACGRHRSGATALQSDPRPDSHAACLREPAGEGGVALTDETAAGPENEVVAETATHSGVRQPQLVVAEERTPLPEVDRAMPILTLFPAVLGYGERGR
jgi:hypothetical protein